MEFANFNALEHRKTWYCICVKDSGVPVDIWASNKACSEEITRRYVKEGIDPSRYIIQKITIDSVEII